MSVEQFCKQQPEPMGARACPACGSPDVTVREHQSTLVGGDPDPNHHWERCSCPNGCPAFTREYKNGNQWYTRPDDHVIRGIANCFEEYTYDCKECGEALRRSFTQLDGVTPARSLTSVIDLGPQWRTFWRCPNGHGGEVESR